ncbi:MAG: choice-of-anchor C family protein [Minisyncoccia bacterium]
MKSKIAFSIVGLVSLLSVAGFSIAGATVNNTTIKVCKIVLNSDGEVVTRDAGTTFTIPWLTDADYEGQETGDPADVVFSGAPSTETVFGDVTGECESIDVTAGRYYYGQETISPSSADWEIPRYHDQIVGFVDDLSDPQVFNSEADEANDNWDGVINVSEGQTRVLIVVNEMKPNMCELLPETQTIYSDTTTLENGDAAVPVGGTLHTAWTASIPGATWIWGEHPVSNPVIDLTETFTRDFTIVGTPTGGSLMIAADNSYVVTVNGNAVCSDASEDNFSLAGQDTCVIDASDLLTGLNTLTVEVKNHAQAGGTQDTNPAGLLYKLTVNSESCDEPEPTTATISAVKIVCDAEADLPNWGAGGANITSTTAADFLAADLAEDEVQDCHLEPWTFEWAPTDTGNPGDNVLGSTGSPWTAFTTTATVPAGALVWVREQFVDGYVPFTGANTDQDVSAELYCNDDVLNYDNYDYIDPVVAGQTYHCIGFNALVDEPNSCDIQEEVVTNGSLEDGVDAGASFVTLNAGDNTSITDWTVDSGSVDYIGGYWQSSDGSNNIDLNGETTGSISQTISTVIGETYTVSFDLSGNPENSDGSFASPSLKVVRVSATGAAPMDFSYDTLVEGNTLADMKWEDESYTFVATVTSTTITFASQIVGAYGPAVDNISIGCVLPPPEPEFCEADDAAINLLTNGSFESPVVTNGALWDIFASNFPGLSWLVDWINPSGAPEIANIEIQENGLGGGWLASDGTQWTELDSDWGGPSSEQSGEAGSVAISQAVTTVNGEDYNVSFDFSARPDTAASENEVEVLAGGVLIGTVGPTAGAGNTVWTSHTFTFTATTTSTVVTFRDAGTPSNSVGTFIDNASVNCKLPPPPIDMCLNIDGVQTQVPPGYTQAGEGQCVPIQVDAPQCSDDVDNVDSEDSLIDELDPGCHSDGNAANSSSYVPSDNDESNTPNCSDGVQNQDETGVDTGGLCTTPTVADEPGSTRRTQGQFTQGGGGGGGGSVLGAVLGDSCGLYMDRFIRRGRTNDVEQVKKLQTFLNKWMNSGLPITGFYGPLTNAALNAFQTKYASEVLTPWGLNGPTGIAYISTLRWINLLECPDLSLALPPLVNWSQNPNVGAKVY